ncbi:MAG: hypothetical protein ACQKBT_08340 [Puniceicoccales bacterium]
MNSILRPLLSSAALLLPGALSLSGESSVTVETDNWRTGENLTIDFFDGFATFRPAIFFNGVGGDSSVSDPGELEVGAHDPYRNGFSLQGLEFSGALEFQNGLGAAAVYNVYEDVENDHIDGEFEEAYGFYDLPGLNVRAGRYLNAFGFQNQTHVHGWSFVDLPLVYGRFLGDHGLRTDGASAQLAIPSRWGANLSFSLGQSVTHDHDHSEHEEEEEDHDHGSDEELLFDGLTASTRLFIPWNQDDFHRWSSHISFAAGQTSSDGPAVVYATGIAYEWLENGYEPGGARFRSSLELFGRSWTVFEGEDDHDHEHEEDEHEEEEEDHDHEEEESHSDEESGTDFGFLAEAIYSPSFRWDFGGRIGYVSGDSKADLDERWRFSPVATWWLNEGRNLSLRVQYNYDILPSDEEQSVWLQLGIAWGSH